MRINQILSIVKSLPYFTKQNLGVGLKREGEDLNYWIKKLTSEKMILPLKKGFYISPFYTETAIKSPEQLELYWVYLANVLRSPSYVSLEYVLSKYNIIPETTFALTSITLKSSRVYNTSKATFIYRNLKRELFYGYQLLAFGNTGLEVRIAYPYKALFDFLYLKSFISKKETEDYLLKSGRINWDELSRMDKDKLVEIINKSRSKKMKTILSILYRKRII